MNAPRYTALIDEHRRANARLIEFAGWQMPLHYGSQVEEHHAVRRDAGMFDVSHMAVIDVEGAHARAFLRRLLANDVAKLAAEGDALYSCLLREDGGVLDDLIAYRLDSERWRLVVNAGTAARDLGWIRGRAGEFAVGMAVHYRTDLGMIAVQGPRARERFWRAAPAARERSEPLNPFKSAPAGEWHVARTGYTGEDGFEIILPATAAPALWRALLDSGVAPCGLGARDTLRLEAGLNLYGQDMDETVTPFEAGLRWTVDLTTDRDFIGRIGLEQRAPRFHLLGLVLLERGVLRAHQSVRGTHGAGELTSGSFAPTLARSIGFARLPLATRAGERVEVQVRERWLSAEAVKSPFVRNGRSLIPG